MCGLKASPLKAFLTAGSSGVCQVPWGFSRRGGPPVRRFPEQPGKISGWPLVSADLVCGVCAPHSSSCRIQDGTWLVLLSIAYSLMMAQMSPACWKHGNFTVNIPSLCSPTLLHPGVGSRQTRSYVNNLELL